MSLIFSCNDNKWRRNFRRGHEFEGFFLPVRHKHLSLFCSCDPEGTKSNGRLCFLYVVSAQRDANMSGSALCREKYINICLRTFFLAVCPTNSVEPAMHRIMTFGNQLSEDLRTNMKTSDQSEGARGKTLLLSQPPHQ